MPAPQLGVVPIPSLADHGAQVLSRGRAFRLVEIEEEDVLAAPRSGPNRPARAPIWSIAARARLIAVMIRNFGISRIPTSARARRRQNRTRGGAQAAASARAADQRAHHARGVAGAIREMPFGRGRVRLQAQVPGQHAEQMRGVLRPPRHAQIDLGDGAMTVAVEELRHAALQHGGQDAGAVAVGEIPCGLRAQRGRRVGVVPCAHGDAPQFEIHLRGHVVGHAAQHGLQVAGPRRAAQQAPGEPEHGEADGRARQAARCERHRAEEQVDDGVDPGRDVACRRDVVWRGPRRRTAAPGAARPPG